jgi:hypothetical protein
MRHFLSATRNYSYLYNACSSAILSLTIPLHKHNKAANSNRLSIDKLHAGQYNSGIKFEFDEQEAENMYNHPIFSVIASICAADL